MNEEAASLIERLRLEPHPEGGWYRETHRSAATVTTRSGALRSASTSIYFLLTTQMYSAFHRIASDETWHFYCGDTIVVDVIAPGGEYRRRKLGAGDVAPGFEFDDFEIAKRDALLAAYPAHAGVIARYTRG